MSCGRDAPNMVTGGIHEPRTRLQCLDLPVHHARDLSRSSKFLLPHKQVQVYVQNVAVIALLLTEVKRVMDPQRADMPVNSGPNDTTVFSRIHNNAYSTDFSVSQPPQSPVSTTGYGPAYAGFAGSPTPDMPSHSNNAHANNLRLFGLLQRSLADESLQRYTEAAGKLAVWMSKEQAFYDEAKPYVSGIFRSDHRLHLTGSVDYQFP